MKYYLIALSALIITIACSTNNTLDSENKVGENAQQRIAENNITENSVDLPSGNLYRCDGFYNGIASEWIQVAFNDEDNKLRKIWYWNSMDTVPKELEVISIKYITGEIGAINGKVRFPQIDDTLAFGMMEDRFHLRDANDVYHEFEIESE